MHDQITATKSTSNDETFSVAYFLTTSSVEIYKSQVIEEFFLNFKLESEDYFQNIYSISVMI